jgi:hypothetical protein
VINENIKSKIENQENKGTLLTILFGIENNCDLKLFRNCNEEFKILKSLGLITTNEENVTTLVVPLDSDAFKPSKIAKNQDLSKIKNHIETVEDWIDEWVALFPTDLLSKGYLTYSVSGNTSACVIRMKRFLKEHKDITKEIIFKATKLYLSEQKLRNWSFTKKNSKFISDNDGSVLEQYCERIKNEEITGNEGKIGHFRL